MTFRTGCSHQVDSVAIAAAGTFMMDTIPITATRMRPVIAGRDPGTGIVTLVAGRTTEQTGVESRIGVTCGAS